MTRHGRPSASGSKATSCASSTRPSSRVHGPRRTSARSGCPLHATFTPYDVIDNAIFASGTPRPDLPGLGDTRPFFLASNRFVGRKNVAAIVRAFARYRAEGGTWRLVLLGGGPTRPADEALAGSLGVADVTFAAFQQIEALPAYYAAAGAFVHAALVDQWGLVVNEALAAGCPAIVSERAGAAEDLVIDGVTGFRFNPVDEAVLAGLLARVAAMPDAGACRDGRRRAGARRGVVAGGRLRRACGTPLRVPAASRLAGRRPSPAR